MKEDQLISALIGLVGAISSNPKTENTDRLLRQALALPVLHPDWGDSELSEAVAKVHAEKNTIAPGCAVCAAPCGNTSDYDMSRIERAPEDIRELKLQILANLEQCAVRACDCKKEGDENFFCKALAYIGYDLPKERLEALLRETEQYLEE